MVIPKVQPFLWFHDQAEEAARFYVSLFEDSEILEITRYPERSMGPAGGVMTVRFRLAGIPMIALNGGPHFTLTEAFSMNVNCDGQAETDQLWEKLSAGGEPGRCGWLTDRFGLTWQIVPAGLTEMLGSTDSAASQRAFAAMLTMSKIDIATIRAAFHSDERIQDNS
ncbi:MAG: VOC family protein [Planctomycetaceae bacterium]